MDAGITERRPQNAEDVILLPDGSEILTNVEYTVVDVPAEVPTEQQEKPVRKTGGLALAGRAVAAVLAAAGLLSYGYLGYLGVQHLRDGGLRELVAHGVFGGVITEVMPLPDEEAVPEAEAPAAPEEFLQISSENIGCADPDTVFNETKYDPKITDSVPAPAVQDPVGTVLLIHTHGTEAYAPVGDVPTDEDFRSTDVGETVVAVGSAFAEILRARGIDVIHCTEMFDAESYIDAYARSGAAVAEYTEKHPEISYVIDIHRDAVIRESGSVVRSDGGSGAQLMIVCGTDEMGADFSDWRDNFAFGRAYQHKLYEADPAWVRHMNLRSASFNQQLCDRYLLLEVGTCGNTLDEAVAAAQTAAECFADLLLGQ